MKHLNEFIKFDFEKWSDGKDFRVTSVVPWVDQKTGSVVGSKVEAVILRDDCKFYSLKENETSFSMVYDKIVFKCKSSNCVVGDFIRIKDASPVVYVNNGFMNVSFKCESVLKIEESTKGGKSA